MADDPSNPPPPPPLDYGRPDRPAGMSAIGRTAMVFAGGFVGAVAVAALAFWAVASSGTGDGRTMGRVWFAVAAVVGVGLVAVLARGRRGSSAAGRLFWIGLLLGCLLMALVEGTCFTAL